MPRKIILTKGKVALVSDCDFEYLQRFKWKAVHANSSRELWYASRRNPEREPFQLYMHREILNASHGIEVDHADHNGLNNTRENIRLCNRSQNCANIVYDKPASGFRGVYWDSDKQKWSAQITHEGRAVRVGRFTDPIEAALARDAAVLKLYGEFAILNFRKAA